MKNNRTLSCCLPTWDQRTEFFDWIPSYNFKGVLIEIVLIEIVSKGHNWEYCFW